MNLKDIKKLAALSRISLSAEEEQSLAGEMDSILAYVDQVKQAAAGVETAITQGQKPFLRNVFRLDGEPHPGSVFTEKLLANVPKRRGQYIEVKKIL